LNLTTFFFHKIKTVQSGLVIKYKEAAYVNPMSCGDRGSRIKAIGGNCAINNGQMREARVTRKIWDLVAWILLLSTTDRNSVLINISHLIVHTSGYRPRRALQEFEP
jgi:hypothetical protein